MRFFISTQTQLLIFSAVGLLSVCALVPLIWLLGRFFGEPVEKSQVRDGEMICQNCKCKSIRPSFQSGPVDYFHALFGRIPFRCEVCYWRFYARRAAVRAAADSAP